MRGSPAGVTDATKRTRFDELISVHTPTLKVVARKFCREPSLAADLLQDTFERAWRRFDTLQDYERARAWLVRIMRNAWLDHCRRSRTEMPIEEDNEPAAVASEEPSPWERVSINDVHHAIEKLDEPFRSVAVLHDIDGLSYRDIAIRLDVPYATVATRLHRAHHRIRNLLSSKLDVEEGT